MRYDGKNLAEGGALLYFQQRFGELCSRKGTLGVGLGLVGISVHLYCKEPIIMQNKICSDQNFFKVRFAL